ncbi:MAG: efflux RND transporter periplasmic adaptor subunit, partial [Bacteriovoracaceae bacterium]
MKSKFNVWPFLLLTPLLLAGGCDILEKESAPEEILSEEHSHEDSNIETFYTCPMHPQIREPKTGKCPICHMPLVKIEVDRGEGVSQEKPKKDHWRCKDYPEVTSLKEDVCPIDGTPMIQASSQSPGEVVGKVKLRQAQMSHFRPSYFQVAPMKMEKNVRLLGAVLPSEERESNIPARVPGRVEKVYIESTGSFVQEGEPVVDIYSPQLITGGEEYLLAKKNY